MSSKYSNFELYKSKYLKYKVKYLELKKIIGGMMNIKVRLDTGEWVDARPYQIDAFRQFKNSDNPFSGEREEFIYDNGLQGFDKIKFTIRRMGDRYHGGIYMIKENGSISPIADWNDVKVFLLDLPNVNWYDARNYQTWAYFDFIYSAEPIRRYQKGYPSNPIGYTEIPLNEFDVLPIIPPIDFEIARNDNGTIFYKKNNTGRTRVRISDNQQARNGYLGFYRRMTDMADFVVQPGQPAQYDQPVQHHQPVQPNPNGYLPLPPNIVIRPTLDDNKMCITCNDIEQNIPGHLVN